MSRNKPPSFSMIKCDVRNKKNYKSKKTKQKTKKQKQKKQTHTECCYGLLHQQKTSWTFIAFSFPFNVKIGNVYYPCYQKLDNHLWKFWWFTCFWWEHKGLELIYGIKNFKNPSSCSKSHGAISKRIFLLRKMYSLVAMTFQKYKK